MRPQVQVYRRIYRVDLGERFLVVTSIAIACARGLASRSENPSLQAVLKGTPRRLVWAAGLYPSAEQRDRLGGPSSVAWHAASGDLFQDGLGVLAH
jgi:hypothetical protein